MRLYEHHWLEYDIRKTFLRFKQPIQIDFLPKHFVIFYCSVIFQTQKMVFELLFSFAFEWHRIFRPSPHQKSTQSEVLQLDRSDGISHYLTHIWRKQCLNKNNLKLTFCP